MTSNQFFQELKESSILTSYNFARLSDFIYAEELTFEQYELLNKKNNYEIIHDDYRIVYLNPEIVLKENDVIFCNTHFVEYLFKDLKSCNLKNLKLITHQSDIPINKRLYNKKPDCISEWYGININYEDNNLIPIPIGISNYYSPKNLFYKDFKKSNLDSYQKINEIYVNFNVNTNRKVREKLVKNLENKASFYIEKEKKNLNEYLSSLINFKYVMCPEGNGIDTHRFWETIYAGSIPVSEKNITLKAAEGIPVILLNSYNELSAEMIFDYDLKEGNFNIQKLTVEYWIDLIKNYSIISSDKFTYLESNFKTKKNIFLYKFRIYLYSYYKRTNYYFLKLKKLSTVIKK